MTTTTNELAIHIREENSVSAETRLLVYVRDHWRCRNCGEEDTAKLTVHHVIFRSQGGGHQPDNLVTICWFCHTQVHDTFLQVFRRDGEWYFADARHWRNNQ